MKSPGRTALADAGKMASGAVIGIALAWGAFEAGGRALARLDPKADWAHRFFRADYERAQDKSAFLLDYSGQIGRRGGYIPERADRFLCERLKSNVPETEAAAIVDFYAEQAGGREGMRIMKLPAPVRERAIGILLRRVGSYESMKCERAFVLAEELRTGDILFKGSIGAKDGSYKPDYLAWWKRDGLPRARRAFDVWWRRDEPWSAKSKRDPFAGSGLEAHGL